jgi:hypothetical protein
MSDDNAGTAGIINNSAFWIAVIASFSALTITLVKICSKSLCSEIKCCCGLCSIKRDTTAESELREFEINHAARAVNAATQNNLQNENAAGEEID